jgi:tetratricopeptide (TPR) repeat protein
MPQINPRAPEPDIADLLRRAVELHQHGNLDGAEQLYREALTAQPDNFDALHLYGVLMHQRGRHAEALASLDRALAVQPRHRAALKARARLHTLGGRLDKALADYQRLVPLMPKDAETLIERGNIHYGRQCYQDALADYDRAVALRPDFAPTHNNRGNTLRELGRFADARAALDRALALDPHYAEAFNNRGNALIELNRAAEALADYDRALALKPDFAFAHVNRGNALRYLGRPQEALASFDRAIALAPELADAHWNKALAYLAQGDFERGWSGYEWRWKRGVEIPRDFKQPQWRGGDLGGKTILLHAEQGFGDSIQMLRYLPLVAARAGRIVLELPDALIPLVAATDNLTVLARGAPLPPFDLHCPLMSLPLAFSTRLDTVPAPVPYLHAPPERLTAWQARLAEAPRPRVGLVWSGKPSHKNDHNRSIPLARLAPLLSVAGVRFVSLQRDYRDADLPFLSAAPIMRLDGALHDFADTAAAISHLDLVIAVDTAVAHLAGALGKPVWVVLSHIQDWRWLTGREDSPWYPTARLFRQSQAGDWDDVIARLAQTLAEFALVWRFRSPHHSCGEFIMRTSEPKPH